MSKGSMPEREHSLIPVVVVTQRKLFYHPPFVFVSRIQVTIQEDSYFAAILMMKWESGCERDVYDLCDKFSE